MLTRWQRGRHWPGMNDSSVLSVSLRAAVRMGALALSGALMLGCGEDPILLADLIGQQSASESPGPDTVEPQMPAAAPADDQPVPPEPPSDPTEAAAVDVLLERCGDCHGDSPEAAQSGFGGIGDIDGLINIGEIIPGSKESSRIYQRMLDGSMPPLYYGAQVPADERELVGDFIDSL